MKAICLASVMTIALLAVATLALRIARTQERARLLFILYMGTLIVLVIAWFELPADCGFLPVELQITPKWLDFGLCTFFFSSAFFGGILQLYNLADRGFSLRILIDILEAPDRTTDVETATKAYASGRGIAWMYDKRISDLAAGGLILRKGEQVILTPKGAQIADMITFVRDFLRIGPVGR